MHINLIFQNHYGIMDPRSFSTDHQVFKIRKYKFYLECFLILLNLKGRARSEKYGDQNNRRLLIYNDSLLFKIS